MASQTNVIEESLERLQQTFSAMGEELDSFQARLAERQQAVMEDTRKRFEGLREEVRLSNLAQRAEQFQQQVEEELRANPYVVRAREAREAIERDLSENEWVQRGQALRREAGKQLDQRIDGVLGNFEIARAADVKKLERKVNQLNKKLKALEKSQAEAAKVHPTVQ